jgi:hypothetical protein
MINPNLRPPGRPRARRLPWVGATQQCPGIRLVAFRPHRSESPFAWQVPMLESNTCSYRRIGTEAAVRTCSIEGCGRKYVARGYCGMHYQRWLTTGQLGPADLINKPAKGLVCQVDGCCKEAKAKGFCGTHYWRWRAHGSPGSAATETRKRRGVPCEVAECRRLADGDGRCRMHSERRRRRGTLGGPIPLPLTSGNAGQRCSSGEANPRR